MKITWNFFAKSYDLLEDNFYQRAKSKGTKDHQIISPLLAIASPSSTLWN